VDVGLLGIVGSFQPPFNIKILLILYPGGGMRGG
jgi:hypothetical protein